MIHNGLRDVLFNLYSRMTEKWIIKDSVGEDEDAYIGHDVQPELKNYGFPILFVVDSQFCQTNATNMKNILF